MCYPKPGPRCSSYALKALTKANNDAKHMSLSSMSEPDEYMAIKGRQKQAQADYDMTSAGILELERRVKIKSPNPREVDRLILAKARRAEALTLVKLADKGDNYTHDSQEGAPLKIAVSTKFLGGSTKRKGFGSRQDRSQKEQKRFSELNDKMRDASLAWAERLSPEEIESLAWITSDGSTVMNDHINKSPEPFRTEEEYSPEYVQRAIDHADSAMDKAPRLKKPIIVYRGIGNTPEEFLAAVSTVGAEFNLPSHGSATLNPQIADNFSLPHNGSSHHRATIIEFKTDKLASMTAMSAWGDGESEVLIDRRTKWRVTEVYENVPSVNELREGSVRVIQVVPAN